MRKIKNFSSLVFNSVVNCDNKIVHLLTNDHDNNKLSEQNSTVKLSYDFYEFLTKATLSLSVNCLFHFHENFIIFIISLDLPLRLKKMITVKHFIKLS